MRRFVFFILASVSVLTLCGFPAARITNIVKKDTIIAANFNSITQLDKKCPGVSAQHKHVHAW